ncbi:MAG: hypothetical protein ACPGNT_09115, partial [Rhodospirillales bacterium]
MSSTTAKALPSLFGPLRVRLMALTVVLLLAGLAAVSVLSLRAFEGDLVPEMDAKARAVGNSLAVDIGRALTYGIPLNALSGMETFLDKSLKSHKEIQYLAVTDATGEEVYGVGTAADDARRKVYVTRATAGGDSGKTGSVEIGEALDTGVAIRIGNETLAYLHVGVDKKFVQKKLE